MNARSNKTRRVIATRPMARRKRRRRALVALGVTTALLAGTAYGAWRFIDENEYLLDERCEVAVAEQVQRLTPEQAHNAAMIAVSAVDRDLPPEAAVHGVGISLQESELTIREADDDRDARVLFARGTPDWSEGPNAEAVETGVDGFFNVLQERWEAGLNAEESSNGEDAEEGEDSGPPIWEPSMALDEAADALDRPHNAMFYPQHIDRARAFAQPLAGQQPVVMTCYLSQLDVPGPDPEGVIDEIVALMPRALNIEFTEPEQDENEDAEEDQAESQPEPILEGIIDSSGSGDQTQLRVGVPPHSSESDDESDYSYDYLWMVAHWAVAVAHDYGIQTVTAGAYEWDRDSGTWQRQEDSTDDAVLIGFDRNGD